MREQPPECHARIAEGARLQPANGCRAVLRFSLGQLVHITSQFVRFYNESRSDQSLGNRTLSGVAGSPDDVSANPALEVGCVRRQRFLGGLLRHYYRVAA